jgi:hypothetical protein
LLVALIGLAFAGNAYAGGLGILGDIGFRSQPVYFYDSANDLKQYKQTQQILGFGAGLEVVLGDRDDRIFGVFRGYWLREVPERHPSDTTEIVGSGDVVATVRDEPRDVGVGTVGVSWGFVGQPDGFMVNALGSMGSGFLTSDHTEYLQVELGVGVSNRFGKNLLLFADAVYQVRFRKGFFSGPSMMGGVRYLFD